MPPSPLRLPAPEPESETTPWSRFVSSCEPRADVDGLQGGFSRDGLMVVRGAIGHPVLDRLQRRIAQLVLARYRHAPVPLPPIAVSPFGPHRQDVDHALEALALHDAGQLTWIARRIATLPESVALLAGDDVSAVVRRCLRLPADHPLAVAMPAIDLCAPHGLGGEVTAAPRGGGLLAGPGTPPFVRLRVAVYDCPVEAGPERFRPGTHRARPGATSDDDRPELQHDLGEGDLVAADPRVLLRPAANRSARARCTLTVDCGDALAGW